MITAQLVQTSRLAIHTLLAGPADATPVVLIHGNVTSSAFWEPLIEALCGRHRVIAPDLRGFGATEPRPIDATRGVRDFSDDLDALLRALEVEGPVVVLGWSAGGGVAMQFAIDHPARVAGVVLESPVSPYGFGCTRDAAGTPCHADYAGSGAGMTNPEFVRLLAAGERGEVAAAPRTVMNSFYFHAGFRVDAAREDAFVAAMLRARVGDDFYPGDHTSSPHWPGVAPGTRGINNALSPKYLDLSSFARIDPRPPVLWIRGADDGIVSDACALDLARLGKLGLIPGWPGDDVYPPQPMLSQTRAVLEAYRARGGRFDEVVLDRCGHSPHIERAPAFLAALHNFLAGA